MAQLACPASQVGAGPHSCTPSSGEVKTGARGSESLWDTESGVSLGHMRPGPKRKEEQK